MPTPRRLTMPTDLPPQDPPYSMVQKAKDAAEEAARERARRQEEEDKRRRDLIAESRRRASETGQSK
jgi:hypothetical protein